MPYENLRKRASRITALRIAILGYQFTKNIGDPVQAYAMMKLLSKHEIEIIDRDHIANFSPKEPTQLILNGWLIGNPDFVEFKRNVNPLGISVHLNSWPYFGRSSRITNHLSTNTHFLRELRKAGTVGARDLATLSELRENGIPSFFSGCATLTFERKKSEKKIDVLCIDVDKDVVDHIVKDLHREVYMSTNSLSIQNQEFMSIHKITDIVEPYLERLASANIVITSRLHAALPAISQGTPVIFAPKDRHDPRFSGYSSLFPYIVNASELKYQIDSLLGSITPVQPNTDAFKQSFITNLFHLISMKGNVEEEKIEPLPLEFTVSERESLMYFKKDYQDNHLLTLNQSELIYDFAESIQSELDELTQQRDELTQQRDELTQQRDELTQQRDELTQQRDALLNSNIWRLTNPIRRVSKLFNK